MAQTTSVLWNALLALDARREYRFLINGTEYTGDSLITHSVSAALYDRFGIGNANTANLRLTLVAEDIPRGARIERQVRLVNRDTGQASEWLSKGIFWPNTRREEDGVWELDAYDAIRKAEVNWEPDQSLTFPMSAYDAVVEFARILGVELDTRTVEALENTSVTIDYPASDPESETGALYTIRSELCWIAAACGGNFVVSDTGALRFVPLLSFTDASAAAQNIGLYLVSDTDGKTLKGVSRVTLGSDENHVYTTGNDGGLELSAPCYGVTATCLQSAAESILEKTQGFAYQILSADSAGLDPAAELGDAVIVGGEESGVSSRVLRSVLGQIEDDGSGYPNISAPGEAEAEDEMPSAGPMSREIARQLAGVHSAIEKTDEQIRLYVEDTDGRLSQITINLNEITSIVEDPETGVAQLNINLNGISADLYDENHASRIELLKDSITLSVSQNTQTDGNSYASITLRVGDELYTGQILITGNLNVSGELSAEALYAAMGDIADLTVDRLCTSRRIVRYLAGDASDDNFLRIEDETIDFVAGVCTGGEEQAANPYGALLYWEQNPNGEGASRGADGYPRKNGARIFTTTEETDWPVMVYTYTEQVKAKLAFDAESTAEGGTVYTPTLTLGAGNAAGQNQAYIRKGTDGLEIAYRTNSEERPETGIKMTSDGYVDISGERRITGIDFSNWFSGSLYVAYEGTDSEGNALVKSYSVELAEDTELPVKLTGDDGHEIAITSWPFAYWKDVPQVKIVSELPENHADQNVIWVIPEEV